MDQITSYLTELSVQADLIKSKAASAYYPEQFIIPYDSALSIEVSSQYLVMRKMNDTDFLQEDFQDFVDDELRRLDEYRGFIEEINSTSLTDFYADWNYEKSSEDTCVCVPIIWWAWCTCQGHVSYTIKSEYLTPSDESVSYCNVQCSGYEFFMK